MLVLTLEVIVSEFQQLAESVCFSWCYERVEAAFFRVNARTDVEAAFFRVNARTDVEAAFFRVNARTDVEAAFFRVNARTDVGKARLIRYARLQLKSRDASRERAHLLYRF